MAVPTIIRCAPDTGPTGGRRLVKIWGGNFQLTPPPVATGVVPVANPPVEVYFGTTKALEETMLARAEERGLSGLRGHRSVGGLRASIYNAFPEDGVHELVKLLGDVERGR